MYLTVREAALRLGVSPVTIRRWTASGVLPCTRTPGGHRRISTTDIDDLARLITEGDLVGARLAREREIDTMISTAVAMTSRLEIEELLAEIARQVTSIFACTYCIVFELDQAAQALRLLAEYDSSGSHVSLRGESGSLVYDLAGFTLVRKVLEDRTIGIVDVDDPLADPAERQILMDDGDASLAMVPMVYKDESIGTIELIDARPRSYTPQEHRLMRSMAALAAVALVNARAYESRGWAVGPATLSHLPLHDLAGSFPAALSEPDLPSLLNGIAGSICSSFRAVSCVVSLGFDRAAVTGTAVVRDGQTPVILEGRDRSGASDLTVSVTLPAPAHPFMDEILDLVAGAASALVVRVQTGEEPPVS
jgi:excisionase family DNA binding protein